MEFERHYYLLDSDMPDEMKERYKSILSGHTDLDVLKGSVPVKLPGKILWEKGNPVDRRI